MPKFNDKEKQLIQTKLLAEGKRLFLQHGLKKVTVDDLVKEAGIAKGSFYAFYTNKEHLYTELLYELQQKEFAKLRTFLEANKTLPPRELTTAYLQWIYREMEHEPLLLQQDRAMIELLHRKVPTDILDQYSAEDHHYWEVLGQYGISFVHPLDISDQVLESLDMVFLDLISRNIPNRHDVLALFITGVVNQLIKETHEPTPTHP